jgi:hypothetical protein
MILLALPLLLASFGCYQERLEQFNTFATAGSLYVQAFHKLVAAAGSAMIAGDSAVLITARNLKTPPDDAVAKDDQSLAAYLDNLGKIDAHATALGSYFDAVSKLADNKLNTSMATSADGLLSSIDQLNPEIGKAQFAGKPVSSYVKSAASLAVTVFKVRTLDEHLKKAAPVIDQALALQEAAVDCIGDQMKASLGTALEVREQTDLINPYNAPFGTKLPSTWNSDREAFLRSKVTLASVDSAKSAIAALHKAYQQLLTAKASPNLASILNEIDKMTVYVSAIESSKPVGQK